jgi:glycosyltransferase involved in cell wall biosynthesis
MATKILRIFRARGVLMIHAQSSWGGNLAVVYSLCKGLSARGIPVWLAYPEEETYAQRFACPGIELLPYKFTGKLGSVHLRELARAIGHLGPVVAHSHNRRADLVCALTAKYLLGLHTVSTQHGEINLDRRTLKPRKDPSALFYRYLLGTAFDRLVAPSKYMAEQVGRLALGLDKRKVRVITSGINSPEYANGNGARIRSELELPSSSRVITLLGSIDKKGHLPALQALAALLAQGKDLHLLFVGEGPKEGEAWRAAEELSIVPRVHFMGFREDIADILSASDLLIHPSESEGGLPLSIMEAMACGVPVVATDAGGTKELVSHNVTGLLIPVGDAEWLAEAISLLLTNRVMARRMAKTAKSMIEEKFTAGRMLNDYLDLYAELGLAY